MAQPIVSRSARRLVLVMLPPSAQRARTRLHMLPNLITTGSLFFGLLAIFYTFEKIAGGTDNSLKVACWYILIAAVLDALDGKIARMTNSESEFGVYYDSLADAVVFGVAPAMLMYSHLRTGDHVRLAEMSCIIYAICGVLRLARFNVQALHEEHSHFTGLPIPGAAAMVVSCYLVATNYDIRWALSGMPLVMIGLAALMVSRLPYFSLKGIDLDTPRGFEVLVGLAMVGATMVALAAYKEWFVFTVTAMYIASGPLFHLLGRRSSGEARDRDDDAKPASEGDDRRGKADIKSVG